jgi:hypothetical protein
MSPCNKKNGTGNALKTRFWVNEQQQAVQENQFRKPF